MSGSIVQILVAALLLLFGIYKIYTLVKQTRRINASKTWPAVMAEVLHKEVRTHRGTKGNTTYTPEVSYKYSVIGSEYNQNIRLSGLWSRDSAQKALDEIGDSMEVRYNPENPNENTHGHDKVRVLDYLSIVVTLGLGIFLIVLQLK